MPAEQHPPTSPNLSPATRGMSSSNSSRSSTLDNHTPTTESDHDHVTIEGMSSSRDADGAGGKVERAHSEVNGAERDCIPPSEPTTTKFKSWSLEILGILLTISLLVASFVILGQFNGRQTKDWTAPINLSTLIATLSTISRIVLGVIASEIISQHKWSWFTAGTGRPLYSMEVFDQASRGPWGSIILLGQGLKKPSLLIALIVAISSIAMGPFAQQAVLITECDYIDLHQTASIPIIRTLGEVNLSGRSVGYDKHAGESTVIPQLQIFDGATAGSIISSLFSPGASDAQIRATCPTGNCTFPVMQDSSGRHFTHRSAGLCSRCLDISSLLRHELGSHNGTDALFFGDELSTWTLPSGHSLRHNFSWNGLEREKWDIDKFPFLNISEARVNWSDPGRLEIRPDSPSFGNATLNPLAQIEIISLVDEPSQRNTNDTYWKSKGMGPITWTPLKASATSCVIHPCLKTYLAAVTGGELNETFVASKALDEIYGDVLPLLVTNDGHIVGTSIAPSAETTDIHQMVASVADMVSIQAPCMVGGKVYTFENMTSAPEQITLRRVSGFDTSSTHQDTGNGTKDKGRGVYDVPGPGTKHQFVNITAPPACLYVVDLTGTWFSRLAQLLTRHLTGSCWVKGSANVYKFGDICQTPPRVIRDLRAPPWTPDSIRIGDDDVYPFWLEGIARLPQRLFPDLSEYMDLFTDSLTNKLRSGTIIVPGREMPDNEWRRNPEVVVGEVRRTTTCFAVDWRWMMFSTSLTVLTTGVLLWTVLRGVAQRDQVWKSSILPLLYHRDRINVVGRDGEAQGGSWMPDSRLASIKEMKGDAKKTTVVF